VIAVPPYGGEREKAPAPAPFPAPASAYLASYAPPAKLGKR